MKTSFFQDGRHCVGIDYSDRNDCIAVCELTDEELALVCDGYDMEFMPLNSESESKECFVRLFEGPQYQLLKKERAKQEKIKSSEAAEARKKEIVSELGSLSQERLGLEIVGADIKDIDTRIESLKDEYALISK